jgi:hypothetical protein
MKPYIQCKIIWLVRTLYIGQYPIEFYICQLFFELFYSFFAFFTKRYGKIMIHGLYIHFNEQLLDSLSAAYYIRIT